MAVKDPSPCRNCGHCPTCGRANAAPYYVPYPVYPAYPYGQWYPYTTPWFNGTISMGVTNVAAGGAGVGTSVYSFTPS